MQSILCLDPNVIQVSWKQKVTKVKTRSAQVGLLDLASGSQSGSLRGFQQRGEKNVFTTILIHN